MTFNRSVANVSPVLNGRVSCADAANRLTRQEISLKMFPLAAVWVTSWPAPLFRAIVSGSAILRVNVGVFGNTYFYLAGRSR